MHLLAASLALLPAIAAAHEGYPGPRLFGAPGMKKMKMRRDAVEINHNKVRYGSDVQARGVKESRQNGGTDGRCGDDGNGASCASGYCCSIEGWCGNTSDYCSAPDCQFEYGPGCDANQKPSGSDTSGVTRTKVGNVVYGGEGIYHCTVPGTVALTYDDGPYIYTDALLNLLNSYGAKATFFITGNNIGKGSIDSTPAWGSVIQRMAAEGHQIASHTWSHQNLDEISSSKRKEQIVWNEIALQNIVGYFPTYMRPPYSACITPACEQDMADLGYHISYFDVDTDDYNNLTPELIQNAKDNFGNAVVGPTSTNKYLSIAHDIHQLSAEDLTVYMLEHIQAQGFRAVTMGECMGDPIQNWYRTGSGGSIPSSSVPTSTPTGTPSTDGSCGGSDGKSCAGAGFGSCCSQYGYWYVEPPGLPV
ncbi:glycoside hydrolase/deacetylase [Eremomyces bilateralis CBS 781.70]|uniref:Glycoside hydrolase/deacetylase n=1 Tax=Eremomyces bilateralis CBS 781.70 TaxID=1392243 RepID=A0A6G1GGX3_9PEZI|nr:glycoside hydrolase/deacetylase [Eremomyces bilateralis CBS 781.70]KAF1817186.1 glycoside hydrolase/deacetylase [Eremomyces bilateralis CBS 781.70]